MQHGIYEIVKDQGALVRDLAADDSLGADHEYLLGKCCKVRLIFILMQRWCCRKEAFWISLLFVLTIR